MSQTLCTKEFKR